MTIPRRFNCEKCAERVIWNPEYFEAKNKGFDLSDLKPTLNVDGSVHECQGRMGNFRIVRKHGYPWIQKFYKIIPGEETRDFYKLDLELGPSINGFITQAGNMLIPNNEKSFPLTYEREGKVVQKKLSKITLDELIEIYYPPSIQRHHTIRDARTKEKIPMKRVIALLLKAKGIDFVGPEKYLVFSESKFEKFFEEKPQELFLEAPTKRDFLANK